LVLKIIGNVRDDPNNAKYHAMPLAKLGPKLDEAPGAWDLLILAGYAY
jgi:hypothetical protein